MSSTSAQPSQDQQPLRYQISGSRRPSVYFWAIALTGGGLGFALAGLSSYLGQNLLPFSDPSQLVFIPQGIAMSFYGVLGLVVGGYQWLSLYWDLGGGYNEFDGNTNQVTILRRGFPGKNREVKLEYDFADIQSVRVQLKEGINPKRMIYLRIKGQRDIPLSSAGQPPSLMDVENQAAEIARYLDVVLEGI